MILYAQQNISKGYLKSIYIDFYNSNYSSFDKDKISQSHNFQLTRENYLDWNNPSAITNSIICLKNIDLFEKILNYLEQAICKHIVLHFIDFLSIEVIKTYINKLLDYNIQSVIIICQYDEIYFSDEFGDLIMDLKINKKLFVLNSPFEKNFEDTMFFTLKEKEYNYLKSKTEFASNISLFSESQNYHTYFNRKLYIGPTGEIKNAPETEQVFGYIQDITEDELKEIISSPHFQKYWFVHKGLIDVCKECEFRHMCVDNRVPIERKSNEWYNSLECNYNPYIGKWEGEEGYLSLADCGVISNEKEFIIDHEKVRKINSLSEQY
jgi:radical SAM protein with 4Fe4S-binding SPASM domain